jgi:hypothetical protein
MVLQVGIRRPENDRSDNGPHEQEPLADHERPTGELRWNGGVLEREVVVTRYWPSGRQKSQDVEWRPVPKMKRG